MVIESGCQVAIRVGDDEERWCVVAPHESDPLRRRISEMSPLASRSWDAQADEMVTVRGRQPYRATVVAVD